MVMAVEVVVTNAKVVSMALGCVVGGVVEGRCGRGVPRVAAFPGMSPRSHTNARRNATKATIRPWQRFGLKMAWI